MAGVPMAADHIPSTSSGKVAGDASPSTASFMCPQNNKEDGIKIHGNEAAR
jgi:hypothetical protein